MVWNTTQSSLNKAVNNYNKQIEMERIQRSATSVSGKMPYVETIHRNCTSNNKHTSSPHTGKSFYSTGGMSSSRCPNTPFAKPIDKDFLLIMGLIFILSKEGADSKLILALAIVLLG